MSYVMFKRLIIEIDTEKSVDKEEMKRSFWLRRMIAMGKGSR